MTQYTEVESEIGRFGINLPISIARHLRADEHLKCGGFLSRICELATKSSYRVACKNFNRDYHREGTNGEIPLMTFTSMVVREGQRVIKMMEKHAIEVVTSYGFNSDGIWPAEKKLPEELQSQTMEYIEIDPGKIMEKAGYPPLPVVEGRDGWKCARLV